MSNVDDTDLGEGDEEELSMCVVETGQWLLISVSLYPLAVRLQTIKSCQLV